MQVQDGENERTNVLQGRLLQSTNLQLVITLRTRTCHVIITTSYSLFFQSGHDPVH